MGSYYYNRTNMFRVNQPQIKQENKTISNYKSYLQNPTYIMQEYTIKQSEKSQNKVTGTYLGLGDRQPSFQHRTNNYVSHYNRQNIIPNYQDQKNELYFQSQLQDNHKIANKVQILQQSQNYKNSYENNSSLSNKYEKNFKLDSNKQTITMQGTLPTYLTLELERKNVEKYQNSQDIQKQQNSAKSQQQYQNNQIYQHLQNENQTYSQTNQKNLTTQNIHNPRATTIYAIANRNFNSPQPQQQKSITILNQNLQQLQNASKFDPYSQINQQKVLNQFIRQRSYSQQNVNKIVQQNDYNQFNNQKYDYSFSHYQKEERNSNLLNKDHNNPNYEAISKKLDSASFNSNSAQNNISNKDQTRDSASQISSRSQNKFELTNYEKPELSNLNKQQIYSQNVNLRAKVDNLIKGNQQANISSSNTNKMQNNAQLKIQENSQKLVLNNANCVSQNKIQNSQKSLAETQTNLQQNQANSIPELLETSIKNPLQQNQQKSNQDNQKQQQLDNESQTQNLTSQQDNLSSRDGRMVERNNQYLIESKYLNKSQYLDQIIIGLPNIGLKCYINSTIQTIRQVYYFDQKIFENPGFSKDFQQLFQCMEERNTQRISFWIQKIFEKSKQNQEHTYSGDAYMCIYNFLSEIKKSLPDNQKQQFDDLFSRNYKDKLKCGRCKKQKIPNTSQFITCLDYQEFGYECRKLDDAFQDNSDLDLFKEINTDDLTCPTCRDQLQSIRKYKYAPKFMLIRLLSFIPKEKCPYIIDKQFEYLVNLKTPQKYEIVGFCNYYGHYYTYTAKYNNKWIEFNDLNSSEVRPDCSKAIYFLLKRI